MSIILQNLDWSQTQTEVFLNIPINGKKSLDSVVIAEKFLKINARPYFFELFFERSICVEDSSCKILESNIKFHLKKATDGWWSNLKNEILSNEQKKEIFSDYENKMKADYANQQKQRSKLNRNEIDKEIERESQIRQKINETETDLKNCQISEVSKIKCFLCKISIFFIYNTIYCIAGWELLYWIHSKHIEGINELRTC